MHSHIAFKTITLITAILLSQSLTGCSGGPESKFLEQLKAKKEGERCYNVNDLLGLELLKNRNTQYLAVMSGSVMNFYKERQAEGQKMIQALKQAGYVGGSKNMKYNFQTYTGYALNKKGQEHIIWNKGICIGHKKITGIVEYTEPTDSRGMTYTEVVYKYDVVKNNIVSDLGLEEKVKFKLPGKGKAYFVKTNKGWRLK